MRNVADWPVQRRSPRLRLRYISKRLDRLPSAVLCIIFQFYITWVNYGDRSRKDCWEIIGLLSKRFYQFRSVHDLAKYGWTSACSDATNETMKDISRMTGIQSLDLKEAIRITDSGLEVLTRLTSLRKLNLSSVHFSERALVSLQPIASRLWDLDISKMKASEVASLQLFTSVHTLRLECGNQHILNALSSLTQLRYLEISYLPQFPMTDLGLASLSSLTALDVIGTAVTDENCYILTHLVSLTWLEIETCNITDKALEVLSVLKLQSLYIGGNRLNNRALEVLGLKYPSLAFLKFVCCDDVVYDLSQLSYLKELNSMWLHNCDSLKLESNALENLTTLKELQLTECDMPLFAMTNLATGKLRRLFIEHSMVTDMGFAQLTKMTTLQTLSLRHCIYLTDKIAEDIFHLSLLTELEIDNCSRISERCRRKQFRTYKRLLSDVIADCARSVSCNCPRCTRTVY